MELTTGLFREYFKKQISLETLIEKIGIYESEFSNCLLQEMIIAFDSKDAERTGYLIYEVIVLNTIDDKVYRVDFEGGDEKLLKGVLQAEWYSFEKFLIAYFGL